MPALEPIPPLTDAQRRVAEAEGPLLLSGHAGSGKSTALAARVVGIAEGSGPERVLVIARSRAAAAALYERIDLALSDPYEELWVGTYESLAERLLREHAVEAGIDPFFETVSAADRLALLLDRLDDLPLRHHEIRGNPGGLLARLLQRIDVVKSEAVTPAELRGWAVERERAAAEPTAREHARREIEFADLYAFHDRMLRESGSLDGGDVVIELTRLLGDRADVRVEVGKRFPEVVVDELEEAGIAHRDLIVALAPGERLSGAIDPAGSLRRYRGAAEATLAALRRTYPNAEEVELRGSFRGEEVFGRVAGAIAAAIPGEEGGDGAHRDEPAEAEPRFWRCRSERAMAQAAARELERLLHSGRLRPEEACVAVASLQRDGRLVAAALEERSIPFRLAGTSAFFQRPEVRDAIAWLRALADPNDSAAVVRALTRPPTELRSVDLARCTTIARRRKLDMVTALEAALESPQIPPEARDRIQGFLKLYRSASASLEELRADVFVRRLIERIGLRRTQLFAAHPEAAERLVSLARLGELAEAWTRREPRSSTRDFVRYLAAVADAGELDAGAALDTLRPPVGAVLLAEPEQLKGLEFRSVWLLGLRRGGLPAYPERDRWIPDELVADQLPTPDRDLAASRRARLAYLAVTRATEGLVLAWPEETLDGTARASELYEAARAAAGAEEMIQEEELFGPAESVHATYRMVRDEVLEASWRAGAAISEMRLDTAEDVNRSVARFLELVKLAALVQRPGSEPAPEALAAINDLLGRVATPEQQAALSASALDEYLLDEDREGEGRRKLAAARDEPSLESFLPTRGEGLGLSASDIDLYRTCPLKYKFARVFAIPQEPTINQRFGILIHQVLERYHAEEVHGDGEDTPGLNRLLSLFEGAWRRSGFGTSDDELQYRDRAIAALARYDERHASAMSTPVWLERGFSFAIGPHQLRGRIDRIDRHPDGGYELIDYKTGQHKTAAELTDDLQLGLYRIAAREAWSIEAELGSYYYVLDDEKVAVHAEPDDRERVERTVLEVGEGISSQDFEPKPSYAICSWCDYRLICPASEA
ncbi:MAG: PD-(D/E)XK nuclease family protein [Solirubrobacterales bacterium]